MDAEQPALRRGAGDERDDHARAARPARVQRLHDRADPLPGSTRFYTVETRRLAGYDAKLPGHAVIIHFVDTTRSDRDAQVIDPDANGNPDDAGAMWLPRGASSIRRTGSASPSSARRRRASS